MVPPMVAGLLRDLAGPGCGCAHNSPPSHQLQCTARLHMMQDGRGVGARGAGGPWAVGDDGDNDRICSCLPRHRVRSEKAGTLTA